MNGAKNNMNKPGQDAGTRQSTDANTANQNPYTDYSQVTGYWGKPKKERALIKLIRVLLWAISITTVCIGWGLLGRSSLMVHFLNGTSNAMRMWGIRLIAGGVVIIVGNCIWGLIRWVLRARREKWRAGKVAGKLIGGGIWRALVFSAISLLVLIFLTAPVAALFKPDEHEPSATEIIAEAYLTGKISVAEYVRETAYATFDPIKVSEEFRGENRVHGLDFLDIAIEHVSALDSETIVYITEKVLMLDSGITTGSIAAGGAGKALAAGGATDRINRLTLSGNGKFAIYWADTGVNQITEEQARSVGEMFERNVARTEKLFGMSFVFEPKYEDILDTIKNLLPFVDDWAPLKKLAEKEGISFDRVKQAMPIYIISPGELTSESGTGAFYTGESVIDWLSALSAVRGAGTDLGEMGVHTMNIPMFPAITILPKFIGDPHMETITAHEFGHHFQHVYRGKRSGSDNGYSEAHANYYAARVVENQESVLQSVDWIRAHHRAYLNYNSQPLDTDSSYSGDYRGYRNFGYLVNYAMEVEGGDEYIWEALKKGKKAYEWLTEKAGNRSKGLWAGILERNLTGDYGYIKVMVPSIRPHGMMEQHSDYHAAGFRSDDGYREHNSVIRRLSTSYFYIGGEEYTGDIVRIVSGMDDFVVILMGYISQSSQWNKLDGFSGVGERRFELDSYSDVYDTFAVCVANSGLKDGEHKDFVIQFFPGALAEIIDLEALAELKMREIIGDGFSISGNCIEFTTDNIFNVIGAVYTTAQALGADNVDERIADLERQRNETEFVRVFLCFIPIKEGVPLKEVKKQAALVLGIRYTLSFTLGSDENQMLIGVGHSLATNVSKVYLLAGGDGSDRVLLTMRFERER